MLRSAVFAQRRAFSIFAGASANQDIFLAGKVVRDVAGKKAEVELASEFNTVPSINILVNNSFITASDITPAVQSIDSYLINGDKADIKVIATENKLTKGTVQFTGSPFAWSAAKVEQTFVDGSKVESNYTFNKEDVVYASKTTGKDGKVVSSDAGNLKIVSRTNFASIKSKVEREVLDANLKQ